MPDHNYQVLDDVLAHIRTEHPTVARRWFDDLEPLGIVSGTFGVRAHSDLHRDYIRLNGLDAFNDAVRSVTGQLIAVRLLGPNDEWTSATKNAQSTKDQLEQQSSDSSEPKVQVEVRPQTSSFPASRPLPGNKPSSRAHVSSERAWLDHEESLPINPDYGFDQFVIGPNNQMAHAAAVAVADNPGHAYNPLFIHGGVGLGKTHLLQAICLKIKQRHPGMVMHYVSCDGFMTQFMNAVQSGRMVEFRHTFRDIDLLVVDDIHFLAKRDRTQEEFFHTFNALYQGNKQIIMSSDAPPEEIPDLEDRMVSRFLWGLVVKVDKPSFETRVEILKRKAHNRGLTLPENVASEIAHHIDTNIRELEGAITKLQIVASIEKKPIDLDLTRTALGEEFASSLVVEGNGPTIEQIISEISAFYHIKRSDLLGKRRHKSVAHPRQIGMYLTRQNTKHSLEEIGAHFGGRDHTTVMHAVRSISKKCKDDAELLGQIRTLEARLRMS
ncbi:MAG: chromosomal replication initiator protein DnaA [Phycisphaerales bacterium]|nr:chromosomal replication initiator protein DnaA [Phycisphaerales bacterium]